MSRSKVKKQVVPNLQATEEDIRYGTPEVVAEYRAQRLKCPIIADLGCSVGFQTFAFAKTCKKVYAVEKDQRKLEYAQKNAQLLGLKNIEFIHGDALDSEVVNRLRDCHIIFCDTERPATETSRKIESIQPNPLEIIKKYSFITKNICLELPPYLREIPFPGEREYVSVHGTLNRLTVYLGSLKKADRSVVLLPEGTRLESQKASTITKAQDTGQYRYIYEINPAVIQASLGAEVSQQAGGQLELFSFEGKSYFFSSKPVSSPFIKGYQIRARVTPEFLLIKEALQKVGAQSVILRQRLDPQQYWQERQKYEAGLTGKKRIHLFIFQRAFLAEEMK